MGANDSPTTTRSIITDYFNWRLNDKTITNNRVYTVVRRVARECEAGCLSQLPTFQLRCSVYPADPQTLNNVKTFHSELAKELFREGGITWGRIITFISFSALIAESLIQQLPDSSSPNFIIQSMIDWTTEYIDTELQTWLENQNYWVSRFRMYLKFGHCFFPI